MNGPQWSARSSWHTFPGHPVDTGIPRADSASPVPARAAPHTRASACTRACTLYGCAARAPHGNDESSTLEHLSPLVHSVAHSLFVPYTWFPLASSLILRASRSRISVALPLNPACRTIGLCLPYMAPRVCERASCVHATHNRVRAERRPRRSCHDFAFVYARSLSFGRDHLRHSRALVRSPALRSRSRCGQVLANLRGRGDMFSFPMIYAGKWVARAWKCHAGRYQWQLSMGRSSVLLARMRPPGELVIRVSFWKLALGNRYELHSKLIRLLL